MARPLVPCADCGTPSLIYGRGLCWVCYEARETAGDLDDFPTTGDLTALDFAFLRTIAGLDVETATARLHLAYRSGLALERKLRRKGYETRGLV